MPKSSIGHYVGTMPQLLGLAVDELIEKVTERALALDLFTLDQDKVVDELMTLVPMAKDRRSRSGVWLLVLSQSPADPDMAAVLQRLNGAFYEAICELLTMMNRQGLRSDEREMEIDARRLHALIDGLSVQSLTDASTRSVEEVRAVLRDEVAALRWPATSASV